MSQRVKVTRTINAPVQRVFETVSDITKFAETQPDITKIEFLSDQEIGVGARFKETRIMKGKEATVELEVTEYCPNERVRLVSDSHGTVWDSKFTTTANRADTKDLTLVMEARPQ